ncbi:hypothetical protein HYU50_02505 [Candidatus Woesearchaeota archaeon]|nr:hypothetical protein [Candidatus Woesearchaeota archaeon]
MEKIHNLYSHRQGKRRRGYKSSRIIPKERGNHSNLTGKLQKGKTGVARLALWARVPVIPVGIKGTFEILPKGAKIPKLKRASFSFGKPMYFDKYYNKPMTKKLLRSVTDSIMREIANLSGQKYNY